MNLNINDADRRFNAAMFRSVQLHKVLDSVLNQQTSWLNGERNYVKTTTADTSVHKKPIPNSFNPQPNMLKLAPVTPDLIEKNQTGTTPDISQTVILPSAATIRYQFNFSTPVHITSGVTILQISGSMTIKNNKSGRPAVISSEIQLKEADADAGNAVSNIELNSLKETVTEDSTISCLLRESAKPPLNEFGLPSYQRKLTLELTGSLKNNQLDGMLTWEEISGRPVNAHFKITPILK